MDPTQFIIVIAAVIFAVVVLRRISTIKAVESPAQSMTTAPSPILSIPPGPPSSLESEPARIPSVQVEKYVRQHVVEIAEENFPDDLGYNWWIHRFTHHGALSYAEAEADQDVGYERIQFVFSTLVEGIPKHIATYCLEEGAYYLLCVSPDAPTDLPRRKA